MEQVLDNCNILYALNLGWFVWEIKEIKKIFVDIKALSRAQFNPSISHISPLYRYSETFATGEKFILEKASKYIIFSYLYKDL